MTLNVLKILATNKFKRNYLKRNDLINSTPDVIVERWEKLKNDYLTIDTDEFVSYCYQNFHPRNNKPNYYGIYLQSVYWKIISDYVKYIRNVCEFYNDHDNKYLEIHHTTYSILGKEIDNLDKLRCLCSACHNKGHDYQEYNGKYKVNSEYILKSRYEELEESIEQANNQARIDNEVKELLLKTDMNNNNNFDALHLKCKSIIFRYDMINHDLRQIINTISQ